jgi:hypothetical protein
LLRAFLRVIFDAVFQYAFTVKMQIRAKQAVGLISVCKSAALSVWQRFF